MSDFEIHIKTSADLKAVRIRIPNHALTGLFFPASNRMGTLLFWRLLDCAVAAADVKVEETLLSGPFNESVFVCQVGDLATGLRVIKKVVCSVNLLPVCAEIGFFDEAELVGRRVCPKSENNCEPFAMIARNQEENFEVQSQVLAFKAQQNR